MRPLFPGTGFLLLSALLAHGQGGSAVITLVMPPPGGEGYSMLQDGGPFADGAVSAYYNPALMADLERNTGSQLHFANSQQDLLPVLGLPDLTHEFTGVAALLPDPVLGADLGVGFYKNHVEFGEHIIEDPDGNTVRINSEESVWGAAVGLRLGIPVSLGLGAKFIDSHLSDYFLPTGERKRAQVRSWAFDFGMLINPRLSTAASTVLPWVDINPSFSAVLKNVGPDVFYVDANKADPIPRTFAMSFGMQLRFFDMAEIEAASTLEKEFHRGSAWEREPVYHRGYGFSFLGIRFSQARLEDYLGKRDETHKGWALELDMLRTYRVWKRMKTGDFRSPPAALEKGYPFAWTRVFGVPFRANPRLIFGKREIESHDNGIRNGQEAVFVSFSL